MTRSLAELRQYLAGEWLFDNNFKDTSGNGNHGTPTDIEWASTNYGFKPRFNGSSSFVNCGNSNVLQLDTSTSLSICTWVKFNDTSNFPHIVERIGLSTFYYLYIRDNGQFRFTVKDVNANNPLISSASGYDDNSWHHVVCTIDRNTNTLNMIIDGGTIITPTVDTTDSTTETDIVCYIGGSPHPTGNMGNVCIYNTGLSVSEALALYNATSGEYGPRIAEFSYQHDPAAIIPVQTGEVLRIGGKLAGDAVDTIGNRALSNDAKIHGAMKADGFFSGIRYYGTFDSIVTNSDIENITDLTILSLSMIHTTASLKGIVQLGSAKLGLLTSSTNTLRCIITLDGTDSANSLIAISTDEYAWYSIRYDKSTQTATVGANDSYKQFDFSSHAQDTLPNSPINVNKYFNGNGQMQHVACVFAFNSLKTDNEINAILNTLAILPFWSINYRDYPDNVTTYTDRFPHSSSIIASGTFKIDDDKIQCTSAGTLTYSASNEFDGQEYITVTIAGTEYSGTGTITQGNTTVSVAQGSNKITVAMGTGDTIDKIRIQFRATV